MGHRVIGPYQKQKKHIGAYQWHIKCSDAYQRHMEHFEAKFFFFGKFISKKNHQWMKHFRAYQKQISYRSSNVVLDVAIISFLSWAWTETTHQNSGCHIKHIEGVVGSQSECDSSISEWPPDKSLPRLGAPSTHV